jgi:hypothetical protein
VEAYAASPADDAKAQAAQIKMALLLALLPVAVTEVQELATPTP